MYQTILVAVDLTSDSEQLLARATQLASKLCAQLHLIYVEPGVHDHSIEEIEIELHFTYKKTMELRQKQLESLCEKTSTKPATIEITKGDIAEKIISHLQNISADLVIMGEHHSFWHLQHTDRKVLKEISCDCLIINQLN